MLMDGACKPEQSAEGGMALPPDSPRRDEARLGEALAGALDRESPPGGCPSEQALADFLAGQAAADARGELLAHAARCDHCRDTLRLARRLEEAGPGEAGTGSGPVNPAVGRFPGGRYVSLFRSPLLGVAAALVLALLSAAWLLRLTLPPLGAGPGIAAAGELRLTATQRQLALTLPGGVIRERGRIDALLAGFALDGRLPPGGVRELRVAWQPGAVKSFPVRPGRLRYACRDGILHLVITVE